MNSGTSARLGPETRAAILGASGAYLLTMLLAGHLPFWLNDAAWGVIRWMNWTVGWAMGDFTVIAVLLSLPIALVAVGVRPLLPVLRSEADRSAERGQALAAGACMAVLAGGVVLGFVHLYWNHLRWIEFVGILIAAGLGAGYLGCRLFGEIEARTGVRMPPLARRFYHLVAALGLAHAVLLWCGGTLWGALATHWPACGPLGLAEWLDPEMWMPVLVVVNAFAVLGVAPFLPLAGRVIREVLPDIEPDTLRVALTLPSWGPFLWVAGTAICWIPAQGPKLAVLGLWILALGSHWLLARRVARTP